MDEEEIRALEPKYTGNTRHLTEGEAAEIVHDPANGEARSEVDDGITKMAKALFFINRGNGANGSSNE